MKQIYTLLLTFLVSTLSFAQTEIFNDGFNNTDESLLTDNGWTATGGVTTEAITVGTSNGLSYTGTGLSYTGYNNGAGSYTGLAVGNAAKLDQNGQDVNKTFTAVNSGSLYFTFLVNVSNGAAGYFAHLSNGGTFAARAFVRPSATAGKINFGISNSSTGTYSANDYDLNTTYLLVVKYEFGGTNPVSLWVLSSGIPATEIAAGAPIATASGTGTAQITGVNLRQYDATQNITIDGLYITNTWFKTIPCSLSLGTETTACNATTLAIDTYNATIPFTGGNSGTYNLSTNVGTIGGDNPTVTAAGNIIISNIPEGTNATLTITGTCGITKIIAAAQCKPVNTLPYAEPFNYTAGNILTNEQRWSMANTGDNILVTSGNLTYTGLTSTGNSIAFDGGGAEAHSPFTGITSGTVYASFLMKVTDNTAVTEGGEGYFAVLTDGVFNNFKARLFSKKTGTTYQLGLTSGTSTTNYTSTFFNVNDVVYVVMGYDFATNTLKAWFNPTIATFTAATPADLTDTPAAAITTLGGFLLRQDSTITTPFTTIDELRVATTINEILSVQENNISGLNVYPNPAKDFLHIATAANGIKTVSIYDLVGKQVLNTTTANEVIEISSLNGGIYMVKITEEGKTATRKLVIK